MDWTDIRLGPRRESEAEFNARFEHAMARVRQQIKRETHMIRAKFQVTSVVRTMDEKNEVSQEDVTLRAVASSDKSSPNYSWSQYTPSGQLTMTITNKAAFGQLLRGAEFYLDFTPVE